MSNNTGHLTLFPMHSFHPHWLHRICLQLFPLESIRFKWSAKMFRFKRALTLCHSHLNRARTVTTWSHLANHFNAKPEDERWSFLKCERTVSVNTCWLSESYWTHFRCRVCSVLTNWNRTRVSTFFKRMLHNAAMNSSMRLFHRIAPAKLSRYSMNCPTHCAKWLTWLNSWDFRTRLPDTPMRPKKLASIFAKLLKSLLRQKAIALLFV